MTIIQSITIDSGATGNMIHYCVVKWLGLPLAPSSQSAHQAKGSSPHQIVGETHLSFNRDQYVFRFIENLDLDILTGYPFMEKTMRKCPAKQQVILGDGMC